MIFDYRAWLIKEKQMYAVGEITWGGVNSKTTGKILDVELLASDGVHSESVVDEKDVILMPHIGLNDKSGKKIYEDDVVELTYKLYPKRPAIRCVIWWLDYKASFRAVKSKNFIANVGNTDKYVTKVIGNIHQDPKLVDPTEFTTWYPLNKKQLFFQSNVNK